MLSSRSGSIAPLAASLLLPAILFAYLADMLFGVTSLLSVDSGLQLGPAIRGGVLVLAVAVLLVRRKWNMQSVASLLLIAVVMFLTLTRGLQWQWDTALLSSETLWLVKLAYAPLLLLALCDAGMHGWVTRAACQRTILSAAVVLSLLVLTPALFGTGHGTYSWGIGSTGLLTAQNDVGLAMAILVPPLVLLVRQGRPTACLVLLLVIIAASFIGTRTGVLAPFALAAVMVVILLYAQVRRGAGRRGRHLLPLVVAGVLVAVAAGSVVVWLSVAADRSPRQVEKLISTLEGNTNRGRMADAAQEIVLADRVALWTIGPGRARVQEQLAVALEEPRRLRPVEVDWIDLVAGFGAPLALSGALLACAGLGVAILVWVVSGSAVLGMSLLSLTAWLGHGLMAGHALAAPLPATSLVLTLAWAFALWRVDDAGGGP